LSSTMQAVSAPPTKVKKNALSDGQGRLAAILLSPTLLILAVVVIIPVIMSIRESLYFRNDAIDPNTGMVAGGDQFVGLGNYINAFASASGESVTGVWGTMPRLTNAFINNMFFTVVAVSIETVLGVIMALIMAKAFRGKGLVRASILIPWAIPTIVSAMMWKLIFDSDGVANKLIGSKILWLQDNAYSQWAIIIADVWKTAPFIGLLALAGLQTIDTQVYEAADVDGASKWQQFWQITLPLMKPALVVAVLFRTLATMAIFELPWGMMGPNKYSVETLSTFAFTEARATRYGPAAAYSVLMFLLVALVAFLFIRLLGADVIGDEEVKAISAQKKRAKLAAKEAGDHAGGGAVRTITSGEGQQ
jgi:multiple sugar transport system permease protein